MKTRIKTMKKKLVPIEFFLKLLYFFFIFLNPSPTD